MFYTDLSDEEKNLLYYYRLLNAEGRKVILKRAAECLMLELEEIEGDDCE